MISNDWELNSLRHESLCYLFLEIIYSAVVSVSLLSVIELFLIRRRCLSFERRGKLTNLLGICSGQSSRKTTSFFWDTEQLSLQDRVAASCDLRRRHVSLWSFTQWCHQLLLFFDLLQNWDNVSFWWTELDSKGFKCLSEARNKFTKRTLSPE